MKQKTLTNALALAATAAVFCSCSGGSGYYALGNWENEAQLVSGSTKTPEHSLPKTEYPFDETGNYIAAWAASGEGSFGKAHKTWASIITIDMDGEGAIAADVTLRPGH
ncbi:MAG: hypothetical protein ACI8XO_003893 [Verrucomicrobiales bacterium]|jgi:hypothetical protein